MSDAKPKGPLYHINGIVGKDPVRRDTRAGQVVGFSMAVSSGYDRSDPTTWYDVTVWNEGLQESVMAEVYKGAKVAIEGYYSTREYQGQTYHQLSGVRVGLIEWLQRSKRAEGTFQAPPAAAPAAVPAAAPQLPPGMVMAAPAAPAPTSDDLPF